MVMLDVKEVVAFGYFVHARAQASTSSRTFCRSRGRAST